MRRKLQKKPRPVLRVKPLSHERERKQTEAVFYNNSNNSNSNSKSNNIYGSKKIILNEKRLKKKHEGGEVLDIKRTRKMNCGVKGGGGGM